MNLKNLYFAGCTLESGISEKVRRWQQEMCERFEVCKSLNAPPHITLVPPFWADESLNLQLLEIVSAAKTYQIKVHTKDVSHFEDRVIFIDVLASDELETLRSRFLGEMQKLKIPVRARGRFHPHITLGQRIPSGIFPDAWKYFQQYELSQSIRLERPSLFVHRDKTWQIAGDDVSKVSG